MVTNGLSDDAISNLPEEEIKSLENTAAQLQKLADEKKAVLARRKELDQIEFEAEKFSNAMDAAKASGLEMIRKKQYKAEHLVTNTDLEWLHRQYEAVFTEQQPINAAGQQPGLHYIDLTQDYDFGEFEDLFGNGNGITNEQIDDLFKDINPAGPNFAQIFGPLGRRRRG